MKANKDKFRLLISTNWNIKTRQHSRKEATKILNGVNLDYELNFNEHLHSIIKK